MSFLMCCPQANGNGKSDEYETAHNSTYLYGAGSLMTVSRNRLSFGTRGSGGESISIPIYPPSCKVVTDR